MQRPIKLLLVDDEVRFNEVIAKRLTRRGMEVTTASSGTEAVQRLRKHDFDAAVVDLKMEDMNGIEVLNIMKKMVPEMPVIMLTGHGSEQAAAEGMKQGAYDYLLKPCELERLVETIIEATGGEGGDDE